MPGGGPGMAIKTVEGLLGVEINYYAQVDFSAFTRFIDELGGVKIDVPKKIKIDPIVGDPVKLKAELQVLNGELALAYARARNTKGGDLDRALRQQGQFDQLIQTHIGLHARGNFTIKHGRF